MAKKERKTVCIDCHKEISDVEFIRHGGMCISCWHKDNEKKKGGVK